ncbi:multisubunit potassium/proton antiporter, PhaE subunit [Pseudidiomarina indica]|uniref:Multisubunit potassium/proton antiporter, PhaE subunit n=1 Tax=Pseudidiomarina indica TaxID=1159017 RepID=A0A1G6A4P8_9GAMM|nr:Na+/H+ antiporter subunit E [Pseudidiomarina indica]SDB03431.1 multisubunit potassium/proton antiporter, PhaE subunit [Pseudidiomarina indica]
MRTMLKSWLPSPWLSGCLFAIWLLLNQSLALGQVLLGVLLAIAIPLLTAPLRLEFSPVTRPIALFRLLSYALVEIVRSSFNVSKIILFSKTKNVNSQFIIIPLDMDNPAGLALLSCLINSTPGTVWVEYFSDRRELSLHVFDLHDENWWIDTIKNKYEKPIMAVFE